MLGWWLRLAIQMSLGTLNQLLHYKDTGRVPDFFEWLVIGKSECREFPVKDNNVIFAPGNA